MKRPKQPIRLRVKCAAALLALKDDKGEPLIPWEHAKLMTSEQIISLFEFDHYPIREEAGGPALPWNLVPRLIRAHRRKTATIDIPEIAHIGRVQKAEADFRSRLLAKSRGESPPPSRWPKRPFQKRRKEH